MILIAGLAMSSTSNLTSSVDVVTDDLAPDITLAGDITGTLYGMRITMKSYLPQPSDKLIPDFNAGSDKWTALLSQAGSMTKNSSGVKKLSK
jgi:methyl-accepting chemotaxis protein